MHGKPALDAGFEALPYVNRTAPKGGTLVMGEVGGFDSLHPFILKGRAPWQIRSLTVESLMARSWDEPFTLYGLLAETIEVPDDRSWVEFTLRKKARFSDGSPVTIEDVIWSFETLGTKGHPRYRNSWRDVASVEASGPRTVRITFATRNRELPLIMGLRPILKAGQWDETAFDQPPEGAVIGSGPYVISSHESGRFLEFSRNPDWWGQDLPVNRGLHNFDRIRIEYFRNDEAYWEAVKTGAISLHAEYDPVRWSEGYDVPAVTSGALVLDELEHRRPSGLSGFVFNTRREIFADRRVRRALAMSFDWEWVNQRLFRDQFVRISSAFGNSELGFEGKAGPGEREILAPFALPEGTLEGGWRPPASDGTGRDRRTLRRAGKLLDAAGWRLVDGQRSRDGEAFALEVLVSSTDHETLASLWSTQLKRIGVEVSIRRVDSAQYQTRRETYDYDMMVNRWGMSLSPGTEQKLYFASDGREAEGTRNYMGVADPAVDAAIDALLEAETRAAFRDAVRALDRVLNAGIYVIPFGVLPTDRIAHISELRRPASQTIYGWWGWGAGPARWWHDPG